MANKNNMELWNKVSVTPPKYTKKVNQGLRSFTSVAPYHQIKMATEQFGPYGNEWGLKEIEHEFKDFPTGETLLCSKALFHYPDGEFPISSSIKMYYKTQKGKQVIDEDAFKKIETDMTTKALSKIGFNADIFMGMYDDDKYVARMNSEFRELMPLDKGTAHWSRVIEVLKSGEKTMDDIEQVYDVLPSVREELEKLVDSKDAIKKGNKAQDVAEELIKKAKSQK